MDSVRPYSFDPIQFEAHLLQAFEKITRQCPRTLSEAMRYSLLSGGKRIRPRLTVVTSSAVGLPQSMALGVASALEMIHCFTLIHDDLPCMDDDDLRRGLPSNHKVHGEALALLAGDGLSTLGPLCLLETGLLTSIPAERSLVALQRLLRCMGPEGVIGGQAAEMQLHEKSSLEELRKMHASKTGQLFIASVMIPAELAGVPDSVQKALENYGKALGSAFQIADDLEDATQDHGREPTSILSHLSITEAAHLASEELQRAVLDLENIELQTPSKGWIEIASQVQDMLKRHLIVGGSK